MPKCTTVEVLSDGMQAARIHFSICVLTKTCTRSRDFDYAARYVCQNVVSQIPHKKFFLNIKLEYLYRQWYYELPCTSIDSTQNTTEFYSNSTHLTKAEAVFLKERQTCFYYSTTKVHRTETYSSQHTQRPTERTPLPPAPKATAAASATGWRPLQDDEPLLLAKKQPCQYRLQGHLCVEADATAALVLAMQYVESSSDNCLSLTHSRQLES